MKYCEGREEEDLKKLLYKFLRVVYSFSELKCLVDELSGSPSKLNRRRVVGASYVIFSTPPFTSLYE